MSNVQDAITKLRGTIQGRLILPQDESFNTARVLFYSWNDRRPSVIVKVADEQDVARVVSFAGENDLVLAVKSGGHSIAGHSMADNGVVLDLSDMRKIEIDVANRTAWAQTGMTTGQFTNAAGAHGLAVGFGDTGTVGIGGITLGGGVGFLVRKYGLTIDNLLAADVVTANGTLVRADAEHEPDLFWAIRGGGGNFGVVTRMKFRLCQVDAAVGGMIMLPATADVLRKLMAEAESAPEELSAIINVMRAPPMPFVPQEYHGKLVIMALLLYAGSAAEGERTLARFRAVANPIMDMVRPIKYPQMFEGPEGPHPVAGVVRNMFIDKVDHGTSDAIVDHLNASTASMAVTQLRVLGGAMAHVPTDATAFAHRGRRIMVNLAALFEKHEETPIHEGWVTRFMVAMHQGHEGAYVNFIGDEGKDRVRAAYPGPTWDRLRSIKRRYDPENLFRMNQNIPPATVD